MNPFDCGRPTFVFRCSTSSSWRNSSWACWSCRPQNFRAVVAEDRLDPHPVLLEEEEHELRVDEAVRARIRANERTAAHAARRTCRPTGLSRPALSTAARTGSGG